MLVSAIAGASVAGNISSRPVGVVRLEIPAQHARLVGIPFTSEDQSIESVLGSQLAASTDQESADIVIKWNAGGQEYSAAYRMESGENLWSDTTGGDGASSMTLQPGEAFWIQNNQLAAQPVYLVGDVALSETNISELVPGFNLIAFPYSSSVAFEDTGLMKALRSQSDGDVITDPTGQLTESNALSLTQGLWYRRKGETSFIWTEVRPYANPYPSEGTPEIATVSVVDEGTALELTIETSGTDGESLDIFYRDAVPGIPFTAGRGWQIAQQDISSRGSTQITWKDTGSDSRLPVDQIFGRYYLVGRADVDADGNGIPDAREMFVGGASSDSFSASSSPSIVTGSTTEITQPSTISAFGDDASVSNSSESADFEMSLRANVIYVDAKRGADFLSGRSAIAVGPDGPKKTISAGLLAAEAVARTSGDQGVLFIRSGSYKEDCDLAGKNVRVRIQGDVVLSGRATTRAVIDERDSGSNDSE
ncbi:MAG: hypothetical protein KJ626_02225 [Verrucomicrobia bacterium]|nr:hypothetical protein [Verrucomicrobiota bacterium]